MNPFTGSSSLRPGRRSAACRPSRLRQRGSIALTTALSLFLLLGFMGLALDFGRLFVLKGELQTAVDSCALAAAAELDLRPDALSRARSAGQTAGNLNRVDFQSATWGGKGGIVASDLSFLDSSYVVTTAAEQARYARCEHRQTGVNLWLLHALGSAVAAAPGDVGTQDVWAFAVAKRASAQSSCPVPLGLKPRAGATAPRYGFLPGEWVKLLTTPGGASQGEIGWMNLDGSSSASETVAELSGFCGTRVGDTLGTPGVQSTLVDVWNARFGLYKAAGDPSVSRPDFTGYSYTSLSWPAGSNAYEDYVKKSQAFAACADSISACETVTGLQLKSGFKTVLPSGPGGHGLYGASRRLVTVPVVNTDSRVVDFACMLMLQPLSAPMSDAYLEFLDNASAATSPCTTSGQVGGVYGPLVPALVR